MGSFDRIFGKAKDIAAVAGKKTGDVLESSKLKLQETGLQSEIKKAKIKIGSIVYQGEKSQINYKQELDTAVKEIDELYKDLSDLRDIINNKKDKITCKSCGASCDINSLYCKNCGEKIYQYYSNTKNEEKQENDIYKVNVDEILPK